LLRGHLLSLCLCGQLGDQILLTLLGLGSGSVIFLQHFLAKVCFQRPETSFCFRLAAAKNLVNQVSLPSADRLLESFNSFGAALTWPETQQRVQALLKRGLQQSGDFEKRWPEVLGTLLETGKGNGGPKEK